MYMYTYIVFNLLQGHSWKPERNKIKPIFHSTYWYKCMVTFRYNYKFMDAFVQTNRKSKFYLHITVKLFKVHWMCYIEFMKFRRWEKESCTWACTAKNDVCFKCSKSSYKYIPSPYTREVWKTVNFPSKKSLKTKMERCKI